MLTGVDVAADDTQTTVDTGVTVWKIITEIFGTQPDGTLAGGGLLRALIFNALLFVPCGYLLCLSRPEMKKWKVVLLCTAI